MSPDEVRRLLVLARRATDRTPAEEALLRRAARALEPDPADPLGLTERQRGDSDIFSWGRKVFGG